MDPHEDNKAFNDDAPHSEWAETPSDNSDDISKKFLLGVIVSAGLLTIIVEIIDHWPS